METLRNVSCLLNIHIYFISILVKQEEINQVNDQTNFDVGKSGFIHLKYSIQSTTFSLLSHELQLTRMYVCIYRYL